MNTLIFGIIIGVILTIFCSFCLEAWARNNKIADAEIEAWRDWLEERERWARREAFKEELRAIGAREMPMMGKEEKEKNDKKVKKILL